MIKYEEVNIMSEELKIADEWDKVFPKSENVIKELKPKNFRVSLFPRNSKNKK